FPSIRWHGAARAPLRTAACHRDHRDRRRGRPLYAIRSSRTAARFTLIVTIASRFTTPREFGVAVSLISCPSTPDHPGVLGFGFSADGRARPSLLEFPCSP